ncbi:bile acid:sodium symporter [Niastella yeongjuensis]|uniref:Bile acid:sodium symporter n=1 Tax=Niastella yeongjuensis TaxID=354355 RepID=A0A1V9DYC1_9BACT|nr:bile acid:sodium symporter family protein [Niastella yeongjuensis]OQP38799.1 bile acid:sodium symporter [Niastella yeongjuensis]SEO32107.1 bile acid:Na+ symporter, BASS family [Niastella yeongjuensis]
MKRISLVTCLITGLVGLVVLLIGVFMQQESVYKPAAVITAVCTALGLGAIPALKGYRYTAWIIAAVVAGMMYPLAFTYLKINWGPFHVGQIDLRNKWLMLIIIQLVMFGMGIQMKLEDFTSVGKTGRGVVIGLMCHFSIMPLMGLMLTKVFHFEPEIAAGIILIGSTSSGLASNVMVYLAKANLMLSVVVTAMATMAAPFFTPLLMKLLAGTLVQVKVINMMMEIIKIVIVPIGAALLHDFLKTASPKGIRVVTVLFIIAACWLIALPLGWWDYLSAHTTNESMLQSIEIFGFLLSAVVAGVLYHQLARVVTKLDSVMPYFSMFGIIYFTTVTTAAGHDNLLKTGFLLFLCSVIHNAAGFFFGYWLGRLFKLDKNSARTVAFEVGLQNAGMASGIAASMGKLGTLGLPAAVFSPWMNVAGSILANYWKKRPVKA